MTVKRTVFVISRYRGLSSQPGSRTFEKLLFQLSLCDLDLNSLVNLLCVSSLVVLIVFDGGGEKGVDEGGLP